MTILNYLLYYLVIIPISLLPFRVLYILSDGLFFLFYYVIGYRKQVVMKNIRNAFPKKSVNEQNEIARKFYKHFCDLVVESLKIFSISKKQVERRMILKNPSFIQKYFDSNKSIIMAGGHFNNWELFAVAIDKDIPHQAIAIYQPLTNKFFDHKMKATRSRFGLHMISTKVVKRTFEEEKNNLSAMIFASDQSPSNPNNCYWTKFLNQDTGVLFGVEKYAKDYNYPVIYGRINKEKRGHYSYEFFEVCNDPSKLDFGKITEKFTSMLEEDINEKPEFWLWSHRRWKHERPEIN